jgi:hypothetical protein
MASIQNTNILVQNFCFNVCSLVIITLTSPNTIITTAVIMNMHWWHTPSSDKLSVTSLLFLLERWTVFFSLYVFMAPLLLVSSAYLCCMFLSLFEQSLVTSSFLPALFSLGLVWESQIALFLFIHYSVPTFLFYVNRATCKKLCTGPVLGLSSNVKSSLYVTFREEGTLA